MQQGPGTAAKPATQAGRLSVAEFHCASAGALRAQVQAVQDALGVCKAAYAKASTDVANSTARIQQLQQQIT
jgi:hypothetical protein